MHVLFGLTLFALIPYSPLVHMFAAPVRYLFRPFVVYRRRRPGQLGEREPRPGRQRVR
ncbi:respiratory nitrate reductase subunit gamma [Streptomyces laurentii]|uniref:respiratory nitrate reductase subunit gamma n=1 Tax=Streptomyces laurentii TaxID=39478 RepID=UPI0036A3FE8F